MNFVVQNLTELWHFPLGLLQLHSATRSTLMSFILRNLAFAVIFRFFMFLIASLYRSLNIHDLSYIIDELYVSLTVNSVVF